MSLNFSKDHPSGFVGPQENWDQGFLRFGIFIIDIR